MAITVSGIDPQQVQQLVARINDYAKFMEQKFDYVRTTVKSNINRAYGGNAADSLMGKTERLMNQVSAEQKRLISFMIRNINEDLDDTQRTDDSLS